MPTARALLKLLSVAALATTIANCSDSLPLLPTPGPTGSPTTGSPVVAVNLSVTGPARLAPGATAKYVATASFSDGTFADVTQNTAWQATSIPLVIFLFSLAFFGQQSWSTLVMTVPTDLVPRGALGKFAGLVGLGGAFGGIAMGQAAGWALDHGFSYAPVLVVAASLHVVAFLVICVTIPRIRQLEFSLRK